MFSFRKFLVGLIFLVFLLSAKAPLCSAADLSPFLDSETIGVIRFNLKQGNMKELLDHTKREINRAAKELYPQDDTRAQEVREDLKERITEYSPFGQLVSQLEILRHEIVDKIKDEELFLIFYKDALVDKQFPALIAIPIPSGASQEQIDSIRMLYLKNNIPVTFVRHGFIVGIPLLTEQGFANQQEVMAFARVKFELPSTEKRPEFNEAFASQPNAFFQLVIGSIAGFQKEFEQFLDTNVKPLLITRSREERDQYTQFRRMVPTIFQGFNHYSLSYNYNKPEIRSVFQCSDEKTAKAFLEHDTIRRTRSEENMMKNFDFLKLSSENENEKDACLKFVNSIKTRQVKNEVVTVVDSSAFANLKALYYEMMKNSVQHFYNKEDQESDAQEMSPEAQQEFQRQMRQHMQQQRRR